MSPTRTAAAFALALTTVVSAGALADDHAAVTGGEALVVPVDVEAATVAGVVFATGELHQAFAPYVAELADADVASVPVSDCMAAGLPADGTWFGLYAADGLVSYSRTEGCVVMGSPGDARAVAILTDADGGLVQVGEDFVGVAVASTAPESPVTTIEGCAWDVADGVLAGGCASPTWTPVDGPAVSLGDANANAAWSVSLMDGSLGLVLVGESAALWRLDLQGATLITRLAR